MKFIKSVCLYSVLSLPKPKIISVCSQASDSSIITIKKLDIQSQPFLTSLIFREISLCAVVTESRLSVFYLSPGLHLCVSSRDRPRTSLVCLAQRLGAEMKMDCKKSIFHLLLNYFLYSQYWTLLIAAGQYKINHNGAVQGGLFVGQSRS